MLPRTFARDRLSVPLFALLTVGVATGLTYSVHRWKAAETPINLAALAQTTAQELCPEDAIRAGNRSGSTAIVAFIDFYCSACRRSLPRLEKIAADHQAALIIREKPLADGGPAVEAAEWVEVANGRGVGFKFLSASASISPAPDSRSEFEKILSDAGGTRKPPNDAELGAARKRLKRDAQLCARLKIQRTPTVLLVRPGVAPIRVKLANLEAELSRDKLASFRGHLEGLHVLSILHRKRNGVRV
ncbi:DsbA family protein [Fimbriimonas ginsengisoli]|nr:hypothetical protein [Fimbriimonas ginsengisoli]